MNTIASDVQSSEVRVDHVKAKITAESIAMVPRAFLVSKKIKSSS
jgi:hypothetical protein